MSTTQSEQSLSQPTNLNDQYTDAAFLDTVQSILGNIWQVQITINDKDVNFKVDTGAEVTTLSHTTWEILNLSETLQNLGTALCGPDGAGLTVLGKV